MQHHRPLAAWNWTNCDADAWPASPAPDRRREDLGAGPPLAQPVNIQINQIARTAIDQTVRTVKGHKVQKVKDHTVHTVKVHIPDVTVEVAVQTATVLKPVP